MTFAGVMIGFDQSVVTVTEGETVTLSVSLNTSFNKDVEFVKTGKFLVFTQQGMGNATG